MWMFNRLGRRLRYALQFWFLASLCWPISIFRPLHLLTVQLRSKQHECRLEGNLKDIQLFGLLDARKHIDEPGVLPVLIWILIVFRFRFVFCDEPHTALPPENLILTHSIVPEHCCEGRTFYIFLLHFHPPCIYFKIVWFFFYCSFTFIINNYLVPVPPHQQSLFPVIFALLLPVTASSLLPVLF